MHMHMQYVTAYMLQYVKQTATAGGPVVFVPMGHVVPFLPIQISVYHKAFRHVVVQVFTHGFNTLLPSDGIL